MADKEFTQICKEILGIDKRLEKIEPEELREIKASIERLSEAFNASKALFDESKNDFDGKYNKVAQIVETFDTLKAQIEEALKSGTINDSTEALVSTFSSKKIVDLFRNTKATGIAIWDQALQYQAGSITVFDGKLYQAKSKNSNKNPNENQDIWSAFASKEWSDKTFLKQDDQIDAYSKEESDARYALNNDNRLIKDSLGEVANDKLIKAINNRLTAINVANLSSKAIDFSSGINFNILKANLAGDGAITISALNSENNKAKSGMIFIEHSIAGFDASFSLTNPDDFETKQKALFNYYISPIDGKVYLFFVANLGL